MDDTDLNLYLDRLGVIEGELSDVRRRLARLVTAHQRGRVSAYFDSRLEYVKDREFAADHHVLDLHAEIQEAKAELRILEDERDHYRFILPILMGAPARVT